MPIVLGTQTPSKQEDRELVLRVEGPQIQEEEGNDSKSEGGEADKQKGEG